VPCEAASYARHTDKPIVHSAVSRLDATYRRVARPRPADELGERYQAAYARGASDLPSGERPPDRPVTLLATAVPRLITLAVAANVLHVLPAVAERAPVSDDLLSTLDLTAAGSLHRCHLALEADGNARDYQAEDWLPLVYDQATHALLDASPSADPPSLVEHAQEAGRWAALAIGSLDRDAPTKAEAMSDCLYHLVVVCVFADTAADR
jgi:hypothetical protein